MSFSKTKLRFALFKSTLIAMRGIRGKPARRPNMAAIEYDLSSHKNPVMTVRRKNMDEFLYFCMMYFEKRKQ